MIETNLLVACGAGGMAAGWLLWCVFGWMQQRWFRAQLHVEKPKRTRGQSRWFDRVTAAVHRLRRLQRQKEVINELPDFFELLALAYSTGASLPSAWRFAAGSLGESVLIPYLQQVIRSVGSGQSWSRALHSFAEQTQDSRCKCLVALIDMALRRGAPLSELLIEQVGDWRMARFIEAERQAQLLSLKLLIPIFVFLLPAVFLVLFAPLFLRFNDGLLIF